MTVFILYNLFDMLFPGQMSCSTGYRDAIVYHQHDQIPIINEVPKGKAASVSFFFANFCIQTFLTYMTIFIYKDKIPWYRPFKLKAFIFQFYQLIMNLTLKVPYTYRPEGFEFQSYCH